MRQSQNPESGFANLVNPRKVESGNVEMLSRLELVPAQQSVNTLLCGHGDSDGSDDYDGGGGEDDRRMLETLLTKLFQV